MYQRFLTGKSFTIETAKVDLSGKTVIKQQVLAPIIGCNRRFGGRNTLFFGLGDPDRLRATPAHIRTPFPPSPFDIYSSFRLLEECVLLLGKNLFDTLRECDRAIALQEEDSEIIAPRLVAVLGSKRFSNLRNDALAKRPTPDELDILLAGCQKYGVAISLKMLKCEALYGAIPLTPTLRSVLALEGDIIIPYRHVRTSTPIM